LEQVGQGKRYVSLVLTPAEAAAPSEEHTEGSTLPEDRYPRGITNEKPEEARQEAAEEERAADMSTPYCEEEGEERQHWRSEGPRQ
jgi:hypothetical protein